MAEDGVQVVIGYHDATKHHPGRYARSLGYLDWATQPDPFRRFEGAPLVRLEIPSEEGGPAYDELFAPGAIRPEPLSAASISRFFYLSLALSAWKQAGPSCWSLRCNPSSGNLHPTEGYAILPAIEGVGCTAAVYHYAPREHGLERRAELSPEAFGAMAAGFPRGCFFAGLSSVYWREAWKYGERAFRYCHQDVGHAVAALRFAAAALGWRLVMLEDLGDAEVARVLGLDRAEDFAEAEPEHPDVLAAVFPVDVGGQVPHPVAPWAIEAVAAGAWRGRANLLSPDHVDWEIIDAVADATVKPATSGRTAVAPSSVSAAGAVAPAGGRGVSAFHVIRTRRSALAFDGRTSMTAEALYEMLGRVMPSPERPPWDSTSWPACIHLFLFVHLVEGLAPGVYVLVRDPTKTAALREACDPRFGWTMPVGCPRDLSFFLLLEADCRRAAMQLSLGQEIAGASAFSLGMVAEFESSLRARGPWFYRRLFWEAGMVGQTLYLEAEAAGLRSTGIGAYFDDLVHDVLGLSGHGFCSLYHFTVGGPIEDRRLTSRAGYPAPRD